MRFGITLTPDDNGTLLVTCPDLPEVSTFGRDEAEALGRAADAIEEALAARIDDEADIPAPRPVDAGPAVPLPALVSAKVGLYQALREAGLGKADLARRLGCGVAEIDRLLDLDHATGLDHLERAAAALGRRIELDLAPAA